MYPAAAIEAINGETVVSSTNAYAPGDSNMSVAVTGGVLAIVDNNDADATSVDALTIVGLVNGTTVNVVGDVLEMNVAGNWDGDVAVTGSDLDDTDGAIGTINVDGSILANASLSANNFDELFVDGNIDAAVTDSGVLNGGQSLRWNADLGYDNVAGDDQTLYLSGSRTATAAWTTVFGKVTEVELGGRGSASLISVNGSLDATNRVDLRTLRFIERDARLGRANAALTTDGTASVGDVASTSSFLTLRNVVADGDLGDLVVAKNLSSMWVGGNAADVTVGNVLSSAFIGGNAGTVTARMAQNVNIGGDVTAINAFAMINSHVLDGTTTLLNIDGRLINSSLR